MISTLRLLASLLLALLHAWTVAGQTGTTAGTDAWYGRTNRGQFQTVKVAAGGFSMEWPKKDWLLVPSAGPLALVLVSKKGEATVVIHRSSLRQPLDPADITDLFAQLESDTIREQQQALDLQARVIEANGRRLVAAQFQRDGAAGPERVRQYSIPAGRRLYRMLCVSTAGQFLAFEAVFAHMAASFLALPE